MSRTAAPPRVWRTEREGVVLVDSQRDTSRLYVLWGYGTPFPRCTCPAAMNERECGHIVAALEATKEDAMLDTPTKEAMAADDTTALVPRSSGAVARRANGVRDALVATLSGVDQAKDIAANVIGRDAWPDDLRKLPPEDGLRQAALIVWTAAELGISPMKAFQYIAVIKGKPFLMARMVNALVSDRVRGGYIHVKRSALEATATAHRPGRPDTAVRITIEDAKRAGWDSNALYKSNPAAMLAARVTTAVGWLHFADVLAGFDVVDEVDGATVVLNASAVDELKSHNIIEGEFAEVPATPATEEAGGASKSGPTSAPQPARTNGAPEPWDVFSAEYPALLEELRANKAEMGDALGTRSNQAVRLWFDTVADGDAQRALGLVRQAINARREGAKQPAMPMGEEAR